MRKYNNGYDVRDFSRNIDIRGETDNHVSTAPSSHFTVDGQEEKKFLESNEELLLVPMGKLPNIERMQTNKEKGPEKLKEHNPDYIPPLSAQKRRVGVRTRKV